MRQARMPLFVSYNLLATFTTCSPSFEIYMPYSSRLHRAIQEKGVNLALRGKSKLVIKSRVNIDQKIQQLLSSIADEKQFLKENRLEKQLGSRLNEMEETLLKLPPQKNNLAIVLRTDKQLHAIKTQIDALAKQKGQKYSLILHIVVGIKALAFMGAYFRLIPQGSLTHHPSIYIVAAILFFLVWILYFSLLEKSYQLFFYYTVKPFAAKHPQHKRSIQLAAACAFNVVSFSPLTTAVQVFPHFIDPHWDTFLISIANIIMQIFTSNIITTLVNIVALLPCIVFLSYKVKRIWVKE